MAEPEKDCYAQEKKKMAIKMFKVGSCGIGAAILLLASAALASAILVREKRWKSDENRRHRRQDAPPKAANGMKNKNEQDEASKGLQLVFLDTASSHVQKHFSGATKLVYNHILALDKKAGIEIKGASGTPGAVPDGETSERMLCSIGPKNLEHDAVSDGIVINRQGFEAKNMVQEVSIKLTKEDITNEISEEQVCFEEQAEGDNDFGVHIDQMECVENLCRTVNEEGICSSQETACTGSSLSESIVSGSHSEDEICDEKEVVLSTENSDIIQEDEAFRGGQEDQIQHINEQLVREHKQHDLPDKEFVMEKCQETFTVSMPKEEIACQDNEVTEDEENEQVVDGLDLKENMPIAQFVGCKQKGHEHHIEKNMVTEGVGESFGTIDIHATTRRDDLTVESSEDEDEDEDNSSDHDNGTEKVKLINQELVGKILEDMPIREGKHMEAGGCDMADNTQFTEGKCSSKKATQEQHSTNSTRWRVLMWMPFVISVFLCSWFFGLSLLEVGLIAFFIMVLSKILVS